MRLTHSTSAYIAANLTTSSFPSSAMRLSGGLTARITTVYTTAVIVVQASPSHNDGKTTTNSARAG